MSSWWRPTIAFGRVWLTIVAIWLVRLARPGTKLAAGAISAHLVWEIGQWPGVTVGKHRYGGIEFRLGRRELGHLHGDYLADLPFPVVVRRRLVARGQAMPHHILPRSGWVSYPIRDLAATGGALALFRLAYERATAADRERRSRGGPVASASAEMDAVRAARRAEAPLTARHRTRRSLK